MRILLLWIFDVYNDDDDDIIIDVLKSNIIFIVNDFRS